MSHARRVPDWKYSRSFWLISPAVLLSLNTSTGLLSGTTSAVGSFPITVTATDQNGCTGTGATYTLVIACNVITVTNPANNTGTAGQPFSETFTQSGGHGSINWSESGTLPAGITFNSSTGVLSGTTNQAGSFTLANSLVADNGTSDCYNDPSYSNGKINSLGHNLVESNVNCALAGSDLTK